MAQHLSSYPSVQNLDGAAVDLLRPQPLQSPSVIDLVLVDRQGHLVARAGSSVEIGDSWSELVQSVVHTNGRVISSLNVRPSGVSYLSVAYPLHDANGSVSGILAYCLKPDLLQDAIRESQLPAGSVIALTELNGRTLARSPDTGHRVERASGDGIGVASGDASQSGEANAASRLMGRASVPGEPWIVTVEIPMSAAFERATMLWLRALPALTLVFCGWLLVASVLSRRLNNSVAHLEAAARRIGSGDFRPIEQKAMPTNELAGLQSAFGMMVHRFNETRSALDAQMAEERRMRQEVESLQHQVIRQERLAAVGQLVSGVAHEINNPLQAILGFAELLQMQHDVSESVKTDLVLIQKESARACAIIRNLAMFARQQTGDAEAVRLADVIYAVTELRQRRLESENIELQVEDASNRHVLAVMTELQQVVLNFVVNAEQAIVLSKRQPGRITVRTSDRDDRVVLEVEDTGPGVGADDEAKLFQPFFTTKPPGQGTGLGLSVSYGIIDSLGGHIGYRQAPSGGAIFYFDLPAASA